MIKRIQDYLVNKTRYLDGVRKSLRGIERNIEPDDLLDSLSVTMRDHYQRKLDADYMGDKERLRMTMFRHALLRAFTVDQAGRGALVSSGFFRALGAVDRCRSWNVDMLEEAGDFWAQEELAREDSKLFTSYVVAIHKAIPNIPEYASVWLLDWAFPITRRVILPDKSTKFSGTDIAPRKT